MSHVTYRIVQHDGGWVTERADGHDRPLTDVEG